MHNAALLVHIPFSSTGRLTRNAHLFEYRGVQFKLVQNAKTGKFAKFADNLLAIVADEDEKQKAYAAAVEFLSALAWQNRCSTYVGIATHRSPPRTTPKDAKPSMWQFHLIFTGGDATGYHISHLPHVENEQQRLALALCMEAGASNSDYLRFLFYWQVLSVGSDPIGTANRILRSSNKQGKTMGETWLREAVAELPLRGRSIGNYFAGDCRDAIGHVVRDDPGKTKLVFDSQSDRLRIRASARAVEKFARHYIEHDLKLNKRLALYQLAPRAVPVYLPFNQTVGKYVRPAPSRLMLTTGRSR